MTFQSPLLSAVIGVRHAFFTREGGVSSGIYESLNGGVGSNDDPADVAENRKRMARKLGAQPERFLSAYQIHSALAVTTEVPWDITERPKADAIVTATPGLVLGVTAADCGPVLFCDPRARVVGAAHAGWKGALGGVLEATLVAMEELGANRASTIAAIGPLIRQKSYEVGNEFVARFRTADENNSHFFTPSTRADHAMFDLAGFIRMRLEKSGVTSIDDCGIDTYSDARMFSYRRSVHRKEADYGRNVHAIMLSE